MSNLRSLLLCKTLQQPLMDEHLPTLTYNPIRRNEDDLDQFFGPIELPPRPQASIKNHVDEVPDFESFVTDGYLAFLGLDSFYYQDSECKYFKKNLGYDNVIHKKRDDEVEIETLTTVLYARTLQMLDKFFAFTLTSKQHENQIELTLILEKLYIKPARRHKDDWVHLTATLCHLLDVIFEGIVLQTTKQNTLSFTLKVHKDIPEKAAEAIRIELTRFIRSLQGEYLLSAKQSEHFNFEVYED